ncbi:MAG: 30S ribosomal protein S13 [Candidatus Nomurabacteria bacterium]|nr:MAG: 30S ribosomal protein S13 [Candidatus Nomurabacteria bacterium]HRV76382.1 30S ribosomal protein S13 [Candidatus Saccharimonadales bacterium]
MARIEGVAIPDNKKILYSLTYVHGIGLTSSRKILEAAGVDPEVRVKDIDEASLNKVRDVISQAYVTEGELKRMVAANIKRLKDIGAYRGQRHKLGLPSKGQRTRTNARTRRGKRLAVGGAQKK